MQALRLARPDAAGRAQRVQAGAEQRFVGVDVADAGDAPLVEQERLERRAPPASARAGRRRVNSALNGSGPRRAAKNASSAAGQAQRRPKRRTSKKSSVRRRLEPQTNRGRRSAGPGRKQQPAGHAQMDDDHGGATYTTGQLQTADPRRAESTIRYLPRRRRPATRRPRGARAARPRSASLRRVVDATSRTHRPGRQVSSRRRTVSTSGSSGISRPRPPRPGRVAPRRRSLLALPPAQQERPRAVGVATSPASISSCSASSARPTAGPGLEAEQRHDLVAAQQRGAGALLTAATHVRARR